jgi:hypothetical protein
MVVQNRTKYLRTTANSERWRSTLRANLLRLFANRTATLRCSRTLPTLLVDELHTEEF